MKFIILFFTLLSTCYSQIITANFTGGGQTSYSSWSNINSFYYTGYGSFPGSSSWPAPIRATDGSTNSTLNRIAGATSGGGPFLASDSIYFGSFTQVTNALGGTLRLSNSLSLTNLKTLLFQVQIGEAVGYDFYNPLGLPKLFINGITNSITPLFTNLVNRYQNGTYPSPQTGNDEPVYVNTWAFQWNLTNTNTVNNYYVDFSAVTHAQVYTMRWDSTSVLQNQVIPEPSVSGLLVLTATGFVGYILRRKKRI